MRLPTPPVVRRALPAALLAGALVLGGCTGEQDPGAGQSPRGDGAATQDETTPSPSPSVSGPGTAELADAVFAQAAAEADTSTPLGAGTIEVVGLTGGDPNPVTVEILSIERRPSTTLVTLAMSSTEAGTSMENGTFDLRSNAAFISTFGLEDRSSGLRYLPLTWHRLRTEAIETGEEGPRLRAEDNSCVCAYRGSNFRLGPDPIVMSSLYPPLPEDLRSVTFTAPGGLEISDLPVG
ncbi:hypothetical protein [Pseudokineococcus sp. 1T1Z-3]|uniref:hypothetical protein n=1 Tax=Pseudokineococcus sp. 1T1Z-3 TaxID=3132745 RepID=UPI00309B57A2